MGLIPKPNLKKLVSHIERAAEAGVKKIAPPTVRRGLMEIYKGFETTNPTRSLRRVTKEMERGLRGIRRAGNETWQAERPKAKGVSKGKAIPGFLGMKGKKPIWKKGQPPSHMM